MQASCTHFSPPSLCVESHSAEKNEVHIPARRRSCTRMPLPHLRIRRRSQQKIEEFAMLTTARSSLELSSPVPPPPPLAAASPANHIPQILCRFRPNLAQALIGRTHTRRPRSPSPPHTPRAVAPSSSSPRAASALRQRLPRAADSAVTDGPPAPQRGRARAPKTRAAGAAKGSALV